MNFIPIAACGLVFFFQIWSQSVDANDWVDEPTGCWESAAAPCAVRLTSTSSLKWGEVLIKGLAGSSFLVLKTRDLQLMTGKLWVVSEKVIKLEQFGRSYEVQGDVYLEKTKDLLVLKQFLGQSQVSGQIENEAILAGFENWWSMSSQGVVRPFERKSALEAWNRLVQLPASESTEKIKFYQTNWDEAVELSAKLYQEVIERRIASKDQAEELAHQKKVDRQKKEAESKKMLRKRFFEPYSN